MEYFHRYNTIARPFDGKLTHTKALFMTALIWGYTIPWAVLPLLEIWGRFAPGNNQLFLIVLHRHNIMLEEL